MLNDHRRNAPATDMGCTTIVILSVLIEGLSVVLGSASGVLGNKILSDIHLKWYSQQPQASNEGMIGGAMLGVLAIGYFLYWAHHTPSANNTGTEIAMANTLPAAEADVEAAVATPVDNNTPLFDRVFAHPVSYRVFGLLAINLFLDGILGGSVLLITEHKIDMTSTTLAFTVGAGCISAIGCVTAEEDQSKLRESIKALKEMFYGFFEHRQVSSASAIAIPRQDAIATVM